MEVIQDDYSKEICSPWSYGLNPGRMQLDSRSTADLSPESLGKNVFQPGWQGLAVGSATWPMAMGLRFQLNR